MNAKRGRCRLVPDKAEAAGSQVIVRIAVVAALGFALSACGNGASSSSAAASTAQSTTVAQSSVSDASSTADQSPTPDPSSTTDPSSTATQNPAPAQSTSAGGSPPAGSGSGSTSSSPPAATAGNVTINWTPPSENVDGTPLTNLAGYDIHYGTASHNYTQTITLSNPGITRYVVANLAPGTYYFAVAAVNSVGTESPLSSEVSATVD